MSDETATPARCEHQRITAKTDGACYRVNGQIVGFALEIVVACRQCGTPFLFHSVPVGAHAHNAATVSLDGQTLSVPMMPVSDMTPDEIRRFGTAGEA